MFALKKSFHFSHYFDLAIAESTVLKGHFNQRHLTLKRMSRSAGFSFCGEPIKIYLLIWNYRCARLSQERLGKTCFAISKRGSTKGNYSCMM